MRTSSVALALFLSPFMTQANDDLTKAVELTRSGMIQNIMMLPARAGEEDRRQYLVAGPHQYRSLWAWDFAFAAMGAMKVGQEAAVKNSLEIYFQNQRASGMLPRVIDNENLTARVVLGLAGKKVPFRDPLRAWFETENGVFSPIPNVVIPWAASRYVDYTHDAAFARKWFSTAEKSVLWMDAMIDQDGLVNHQAPYSDWQDSIQRVGRVAFTNELYALSLLGLSDWAGFLGDREKEVFYLTKYTSFLRTFHTFFWDEKTHTVRNFEGDTHLSADANLLAVAHGLLPLSESVEVMEKLRSSPLWTPMPGRATWPNYPTSLKSKLPRFVGLSGYHDEMTWLWLSSLAAIAEMKTGNKIGYVSIISEMSRLIVSGNGVHEVYELKKNRGLVPVKRPLYRAETPFTWSSGLFLEAVIEP